MTKFRPSQMQQAGAALNNGLIWNGTTWVPGVVFDANAIPKALVDAKGDLLVASGADTLARLAVGPDGSFFTADASAPNGVKWGTPPQTGVNVQDENGAPILGVTTLDFQGAGVTAVAGSGEVVITVPGTSGGAGHVILDEGTALAARSGLNFIGSGVTVTDDAGNNRSVVTIPGGGGGGSAELAAAVMYNPTVSAPTGLYSWHHSEAGLTVAGDGRATTWADQSGNARNFTGAASLGPFVENTMRHSSIPSLRDGRMTSAINPGTGTAARTIIMVTGNLRLPGGTWNHLCSYGNQTVDQAWGIANIENGSQRIGLHYWSNSYGQGPHWSGTEGPMVICARYNGAQDEIIVNGHSSGKVTKTLATGSGEGLNLHSRIANTEFAQATTYVLMVWTRALTDAEVRTATLALGAYYRIGGLAEGLVNLTGSLDAEGVRDTMGATLVGGTGIGVAVDDAANTITLNYTGGGGGGGVSLDSMATVTGTYLASAGQFLLVDCTAEGIALSLPSAAALGQFVTAKKMDTTTNPITITAADAALIDGDANAVITSQWTTVTFVWGGTMWVTKSTSRDDPGSIGETGAAVRDRRWMAGTGQVTIDEFNNSSLDVAWTRVDAVGGAARAVWTERADVLSVKTEGSDAAAELHAMMRPLSSAGGVVNTGDSFITCVTLMTNYLTNYIMGGIVLADGNAYGAGNQVSTLNFANTAGQTNDSRAFTGYSTNATSAGAINTTPMVATFTRLVYLGASTWRADISPDGVSWILGTATTSKTVTPTHVGLLASSWGAAIKGVASYEFLRRQAGVT